MRWNFFTACISTQCSLRILLNLTYPFQSHNWLGAPRPRIKKRVALRVETILDKVAMRHWLFVSFTFGSIKIGFWLLLCCDERKSAEGALYSIFFLKLAPRQLCQLAMIFLQNPPSNPPFHSSIGLLPYLPCDHDTDMLGTFAKLYWLPNNFT